MGYQTDIGDMVLEQSEKPVKIHSPIISRWGNVMVKNKGQGTKILNLGRGRGTSIIITNGQVAELVDAVLIRYGERDLKAISLQVQILS
jgi:hypothetical protein